MLLRVLGIDLLFANKALILLRKGCRDLKLDSPPGVTVTVGVFTYCSVDLWVPMSDSGWAGLACLEGI